MSLLSPKEVWAERREHLTALAANRWHRRQMRDTFGLQASAAPECDWKIPPSQREIVIYTFVFTPTPAGASVNCNGEHIEDVQL